MLEKQRDETLDGIHKEIDTLKKQKEEVEKILWLSKDEIEDMILKGMIRKSTAQAYLQYVKDKY